MDLKIMIKECENYEQLDFLAQIFIFNEEEEQCAMIRTCSGMYIRCTYGSTPTSLCNQSCLSKDSKYYSAFNFLF